MTRRRFTSMAAIPFVKQAPAVKRVEVFSAPYPVTGYFRFLPKPERPSVLVKITCEDGTFGWGQSVPIPTWSYETPEAAEHTLRHYLAPVMIGRNPTDLPGAHEAMRKAISPSYSTGMPITKAGIDLALHDIAGKLANKNVAALWGRKPVEKVALSWTVNVRSLAEVEPLMAEGTKRGYRHFNIKVAPDVKADIELAKTVRRLAPDCFLWADANGGYDLASALEAAPKLKTSGVNVLEQPVPPNRLSWLAELKKQGALPLLLDEGVVSVTDLEEFDKLGLLDGVAMKPARTAGLWDAERQVAYLEREKKMFLGSGLTDPDVALAAALILYGAYGLEYPAALNGLQFLAGSFLKQPFTLEDGALRVPTGPGLGVEIEEGMVRHAAGR